MPYELFFLDYFLLSPYRQSACVQPSLSCVNNSADGYRILAAQEKLPKRVKLDKNRNKNHLHLKRCGNEFNAVACIERNPKKFSYFIQNF